MRVMVVGASSDPEKFGNKAVRAFAAQGDEVFPVNPRGGEIEGLRAYESIESVPGPIDRASMYLPPKRMPAALDALAARGDVGEVWLNPGTDSPEVVAHAKALGLQVVQACSIAMISMGRD